MAEAEEMLRSADAGGGTSPLLRGCFSPSQLRTRTKAEWGEIEVQLLDSVNQGAHSVPATLHAIATSDEAARARIKEAHLEAWDAAIYHMPEPTELTERAFRASHRFCTEDYYGPKAVRPPINMTESTHRLMSWMPLAPLRRHVGSEAWMTEELLLPGRSLVRLPCPVYPTLSSGQGTRVRG